MLADLRRAFSLLTILPAGGPVGAEGSPGKAMAFFSLVGAVIGGVLAGTGGSSPLVRPHRPGLLLSQRP